MRYAQKFERVVIVDTNVNPFFKQSLGDFFLSDNPLLYFLDSKGQTWPPLKELKHQPEVQDLLSQAIETQGTWLDGSSDFRDSITGKVLTFDFGTDHDETVLIHHQAGGGLGSVFALTLVELQPAILRAIMKQINEWGNYRSVHVRDSDYRTNFIDSLPRILNGRRVPFFVASDNRDVIEVARGISKKNGQTIVERATSGNSNLETILDLFLLATSQRFFALPLASKLVVYSGFSRLTAFLWLTYSPSVAGFLDAASCVGGLKNRVISLARFLVGFGLTWASVRANPKGVFRQLRDVRSNLATDAIKIKKVPNL
jgi:hypothetical protein